MVYKFSVPALGNDATCTYLCRKLRKRDASKFHIQLSIALFGMLLFFLVGIDRTETEIGCTIMSLFIQYFTLASVCWMGAEAVLMFQKLIIVFGRITVRYIVIVSLVCWCKFLTFIRKYRTVGKIFQVQ